MPLPLTVSCFSKIQIGFTFLVPAYPGCPGKEAVKWLLLLLLVHCKHILQLVSCTQKLQKLTTERHKAVPHADGK